MDNGDAFLAFLEESVGFLADRKPIEYFQEQLPSSTDDGMARIIERFADTAPERRERFQSTLSRRQRSLFGIFGHRAATISLRERSRARLLQGLIGAVISNYVVPEKRRVEIGLAVYHHCARQLQVNTVDLFDEAATYATPTFAATLREFGRRSDVTLNRFGWEERQTPDGVTFKFSWG